MSNVFRVRPRPLVDCVKSCKLMMGSGEAIPSEPTLARSPRQASEVGGEGVASVPLVDLSEPQAAAFDVDASLCFSAWTARRSERRVPDLGKYGRSLNKLGICG